MPELDNGQFERKDETSEGIVIGLSASEAQELEEIHDYKEGTFQIYFHTHHMPISHRHWTPRCGFL